MPACSGIGVASFITISCSWRGLNLGSANDTDDAGVLGVPWSIERLGGSGVEEP